MSKTTIFLTGGWATSLSACCSSSHIFASNVAIQSMSLAFFSVRPGGSEKKTQIGIKF